MKTTIKKRKKDIRTIRKEAKANGFINIRFSVLEYHYEKFVYIRDELYNEFIEGNDKARCDWAKKFIIQITDGEYDEDDLLALKIDNIDLLKFCETKWIDTSDRTHSKERQAEGIKRALDN